MRRRVLRGGALLALMTTALLAGEAAPVRAQGQGSTAPLTQLRFDIIGVRLVVDPPALTVPKQIATQINTSLVLPAGSGTDTGEAVAALVRNGLVEGTLRGPSIPPTRLTARPGEPLRLPAFALPGDYFLDGIRLVNDGEPLLDATAQDGAPATTIAIKVISEVLVTSVTSRPLSLDEIKEKGIVIDQNNFQAVNFQVAFNIDGSPFTIQLPVALPTRELLNTRPDRGQLVTQLAVINRQLSTLQTALPPQFDRPGLNFSIAPLPFVYVPEDGDDPLFTVPPITGLVVIPGNVAFLNQFFSVMLMVSNVAPDGTPLVLRDVRGTIKLPTGLDRVPGASYENPGDDPLRLARIEGVGLQPTVKVVQIGPDGTVNTADDIATIPPQKDGHGEFLVEGLKEGGHIFDIEIDAVLDGLPSGPVNLVGAAAGAVFVRNPTFSVTLAHPRTIRSGEPYDLFATVTNTSRSAANLVSVNLDPLGISGAQLVSPPSVSFESLAPGQAVTAKFRLIAQQTGEVTASSFTGEADGGIRLFTGVGERGVPLAPNAIVLPTTANALPDALVAAAQRVLGQAFSIATAPAEALPPDVLFVKRQTVIDHGLELAEAGQRVLFGDTVETVVRDLHVDWLGARVFDTGFDQLMRTTDAGRAFLVEVANILGPGFASDPFSAQGALVQQALARSVPITGVARTGNGLVTPELSITFDDGEGSALAVGDLPRAAILPMPSPSASSALGVVVSPDPGRYTVEGRVPGGGPIDFAVSAPLGTGGTSQRVIFPQTTLQAGGRIVAVIDLPAGGVSSAQVDTDGDGLFDLVLTGTPEVLADQPLQVVDARQLESSFFEAPGNIRDPATYGLLVAVLFNKPVPEASAETRTNYAVDSNRVVGAAQQAGGRLVYLYLEKPIGALVPRTLTATGILDARGNTLPATTRSIRMALTDGARVFGQVREATGSGVPNSVLQAVINFGPEFSFTVASILTDAQGGFDFDFIPRLGTLSLTAQHPQTLALAQLSARIRAQGEQLLLNPTFLGLGTVRGRVLRDDGATPVANAIVALLPGSVLGSRGLQTAANALGEFVFTGVPVGVFTLRAIDGQQASGQSTAVLPAAGGQVAQDIVVVDDPENGGRLVGRVFESDGATPAVGYRVYVGSFSRSGGTVSAIDQATTDSTGSFAFATTLPANGYDVIAVDPATSQIGTTRATVVALTTTAVSVVMESTGAVQGVVFNANGQPVAGALVAGGVAIVQTDANGFFRLDGVPAGRRAIEAGDPVTRRRGLAQVEVLPGQTVNASIRLEGRATITGRVLDANGNPVPGASVRLPQMGGYQFVIANNQGVFTFPDLPLGDYLIQAPGPSAESLIQFLVANGYDPSIAFTTGDGPPPQQPVSSGDGLEAVRAAYQNAVRTFFSVDESLLGLPVDTASGFGFNKVRLQQDGVSQVADVKYLQQGTVSGRTVDSAGRGTGALVRVSALKLGLSGSPLFGELERKNSDAATGAFRFSGVPRFDLATFQTAGVRGGDFSLEAAQQFSPTIIQFRDQLNTANPDRADIVLQFPSAALTNGTVKGIVLMPDGVTPAPAGTTVRISFGDLTVTTGADGRFTSALPIPAGGYSLTAQTPTGGLRGQATALVPAGGQVNVTIRLLGLGTVNVLVKRANAQPVPNAIVRLRRGTFPSDTADGSADAFGALRFVNLSEGPFSVEVEEPITGLRGRASGVVVRDAEVGATVTLTPSGRVSGVFLTADTSQPIPFAQVSLSGAVQAYATTATTGRFELTSIPVGPFTVEASDPATGRRGRATGELLVEGQVVEVVVVQLPRGAVSGFLLNADGVTGVAGANVELTTSSFIPTSLQVTTRGDGSFRFEGVPAGGFTLRATDPVSGAKGSATGSLTFEGEIVDRNITLEPFGALRVTVLSETGQPAPNATIAAAGREVGVDVNGQFTFENLTLGTYRVTAQSLAQPRNGGEATATIDEANETVDLTVRLRGVAPVTVRVVAADGLTPVPSASVTLNAEGSFGNEPAGPTATTIPAFTDATGVATIVDVPVGDYSARAESGPLAGVATGSVAAAGQASQVTVTLGAAGAIAGRVLLPDGQTPAARALVTLNFQSQSGLQSGVLQVTTDLTGTFAFAGIPLGPFTIGAFELVSNGVRTFSGSLATGGQALAVGDIVLDNTGPRVISVTPATGSVGVQPGTTVVVNFSEPMLATSLTAAAVSLLDGSTPVLATLAVSPDRRSVTLTPSQPLRGSAVYTLVVKGAPDGPRDESNIAMVDPFISNFAVRDVTPPVLLSLFPAANAREVAPEAVLRATFSEPIAGGTLVLRSANGDVVPAQTALTLGNTALVLSPVNFLPANATFTATLSNVTDLAGNPLAGGAVTFSFQTVDTIAPLITALAVQGTARAGATITIVPTIDTSDVERVEYQAGTLSRVVAISPYTTAIALALDATELIVTARAVDASGNRSAPFQITVPVAQNQPPTVQLVNVGGQTIVPQGAALQFDVVATDDVALAQLNFTATGAATASVTEPVAAGTTNTTRRFTVNVPADATPGAAITVQAAALDTGALQSTPAVLNLSVRDGVAPSVTITAPAAGAQATPGQTLTVTVMATDAGNVTAVTLTCNPILVGCETRAVSPAATTTTQTFSVTVPASLQAPASIILLASATDAAGNVGQAGRTVPVADIVEPALTNLQTVSGATRVLAGTDAALRATVSDNVGVVAVDFSTEGAFVTSGSAAVTPASTSTTVNFSIAVPANAPNGGTVTVRARARDAAGNLSPLQSLVLTIGDAQAPVVSIQAPEAGAVFTPGDTISVQASATDDVAVAQIALRARGVLTFDETRTFTPPVTPAQATFLVATLASTTPGTVTLTVEATDTAGNVSAEVVRQVTLRDASAPAVSVTSPAAGAGIDPRNPLTVNVDASDNVGVVEVGLTTTGLVTGTQTAPLAVPATSTSQAFTVTFAVPPISGGQLTLTGTARDAAGNQTASTAVTVSVLDVVAPTVTTVAPAAGGAGVDLATTVTVSFSEPVQGASVTANTVRLLAGANPVAATLAVAPDSRSVTLTPQAPLAINTLYTVSVTTGVSDVAGNALAAAFTSTFRTASPDVTAPKVSISDPVSGAVGVGTTSPISVTFTEAVEPATVTAASFQVSVGGTPVAGSFGFLNNGTTVRFTPTASLPFDSVVVVELTGGITDLANNALVNADGSAVTTPITITFLTGAFALVQPVGTTVVENTTVTLEAAGASSLQVASVVFTVNGVAQPAVTASPFTRTVTVPAASSPTFTVVASARNASNVEIARAERAYTVLSRLTVEPAVLGLDRAGTGRLRFSLAQPATEPITITLAAANPAVVTLPNTPIVIPAGESTAVATVTACATCPSDPAARAGAAVGNTTITATSSRGIAAAIVTVSDRQVGSSVTAEARIVGAALTPAPSLGQVFTPVSSQSTLGLTLLSSPAGALTPVSVTSSNPAVATATATGIDAGTSTTTLSVTTGTAGTAVLTLEANGQSWTVTVVVGSPSADRTPMTLAPIVGATVARAPSAGLVIVPVSSVTSPTLTLLSEANAGGALNVTVTTSDPTVATAIASAVQAGSRTTTLQITSGAAGTAELTLQAGTVVRTVTVVVGTPSANQIPPVFAPIVGFLTPRADAFIGQAFVPINAAPTLGLVLLAAPAAAPVPVTVTSSDAAVVQVANSPVEIPIGSRVAPIALTSGAGGTATLTLTVNGQVQTFRVTVGAPTAETPVVAAPLVGVVVNPANNAVGRVVAPAGPAVSAGLGVQLLTTPATAPVFVTVTSSNPSVASAGAGTIGVGDRVVPVTITTTGAQGVAVLTFEFDGQRRELVVVVGNPAASELPAVVAPVIGVQVQP